MDGVAKRIAERKLLIQRVEERIAAHGGPHVPRTVVGAVEKLWVHEHHDGRDEDEKKVSPRKGKQPGVKGWEEEDGLVVVLPNGRRMRGRFQGTWDQLLGQLEQLEKLLRLMIPPKSLKGSWTLRIPRFVQPKLPAHPSSIVPDLEPIPPFQYSARAEMPNRANFDVPLLPTDDLELAYDQVIDDQTKALLAGEKQEHEEMQGSDLDVARNQKSPKRRRPTRGSERLRNNKRRLKSERVQEENPKTAKEIADMVFGQQFRAPNLQKWDIVDHAREAAKMAAKLRRQHRTPKGGLPKFKMPKLTKIDQTGLNLSELPRGGENAAEDPLFSVREPCLEDFLPPMQAEPAWDENVSRSLILNAKDITRLQKQWLKRAESKFPAEPSGSRKNKDKKGARKGNVAPFRQHQSLPGLKRVDLPVEKGQALFSKGQQYAYVEFQQDMGDTPIIDFLQVGSSWSGVSCFGSSEIELHDVTNEGFVIYFKQHDQTAQNTSLFQLPLGEHDGKTSDESKGASENEDDKNDTSGGVFPCETDGEHTVVMWRALHSDWEMCGALTVEQSQSSSALHSGPCALKAIVCSWQPQKALANGYILEFPAKPLLAPPVWSSIQDEAEIQQLLADADFKTCSEYNPPPFPSDEIDTVCRRHMAESKRYKGFKAVIVFDCSPEMKMNDMWQRAKLIVRSFLSPGGGAARGLFAEDGELELVAFGVNEDGQALPKEYRFKLTSFDANALCEAQRWVAGLETVSKDLEPVGSAAWFEARLRSFGKDCQAVFFMTCRTSVVQSLSKPRRGSFARPFIHLVYLCQHERSQGESPLVYASEAFATSVCYVDFGFLNGPARLSAEHVEHPFCLDQAEECVVDEPNSIVEQTPEVTRIKSVWEKAVRDYDERYGAQQDAVRLHNRKILENAKTQHADRCAQRAAIQKETRDFVVREKGLRALWKWHNMACLVKKRESLTALNIFLAVASVRRVAETRKKIKEVKEIRDEALECASDALVAVFERAMVQIRKRSWINHTEQVQQVREENKRAIEEAREALALEMQERQEASRARKLQWNEATDKTNEQLRRLTEKRNERVREQNERLLMAAQEVYQRKLEAAKAKLHNPHLYGLWQAFKNKRRVLNELLLAHFGLPSEKCVRMLGGSGMPLVEDALTKIPAIQSHQSRVARWPLELEEKAHVLRIEQREWRILKEEFADAMLQLIEANGKLAPTGCGGPEANEKKQTSSTGALLKFQEGSSFTDQKEIEAQAAVFQAKLVAARKDAQALIRSIESKHSPAQVRGWKLLLEPSTTFGSVIGSKQARFQKDVAVARHVVDLLGFMDRIQLENEGQQTDSLWDDLESFADASETSTIKVALQVVIDQLQTSPVNVELLRTLRARLGVSLGPDAKAKAPKTSKSSVSIGPNGRKHTLRRGSQDSAAMFSSKNIPWSKFHVLDKLRASNQRALVTFRYWLKLSSAHLRAENLARESLAEDHFAKALADFERQNAEEFERERQEWQQRVVEPIAKRNAEREQQALHAQSQSMQNLKRNFDRLLKEAHVQYQSQIVQPIEDFNEMISKLTERTKAAKQELKLLELFRSKINDQMLKVRTTSNQLGGNNHSIGGASKILRRKIVPFEVLKPCLEESLKAQNISVGAASNHAIKRRNQTG